ncbi:hypothetical protein DSM107007_49910 [Nostoc sp. PCC 7120 = FACHB-418]|nr:hypothetical protein DSM107007_49910 [Nostoc sp. PCC 7120 = FACHB-418]
MEFEFINRGFSVEGRVILTIPCFSGKDNGRGFVKTDFFCSFNNLNLAGGDWDNPPKGNIE